MRSASGQDLAWCASLPVLWMELSGRVHARARVCMCEFDRKDEDGTGVHLPVFGLCGFVLYVKVADRQHPGLHSPFLQQYQVKGKVAHHSSLSLGPSIALGVQK
uniref:Uncharacterized protein n=1 Tax=Dunaliella tertiolecta TaxID=3047 RepID=A0A7S3QTL9_DUNTE